MIFFILCIINIIALLPFVYRLAGVVYGVPAHRMSLLRMLPRKLFFAIFGFLFGFWCAFSVVLLWNLGALNPMSARLDIGCSVLFVCVVYVVRCIPIYYGEGSDVQSRRRYVSSFIKEIGVIVVLTAALEVVSFMLYAYLVSAGVGLVLLMLRIHKFAELRKKYKDNE
jgi:hypothetical protein